MALLDFLNPLNRIAGELKILRELYELDLASRQQPVYRTTEQPSKSDTEVSYQGIVDDRPAYKRWWGGEDAEREYDDEL